jgi:hypothetical protein
VIAVDGSVCAVWNQLRVVQEQDHIGVQRGLVALESQSIVAALIDDLAGDVALAVERIGGHDHALQ